MRGRELPGSVVQEWVGERLSFRAQTVLLSALRGCDGKPKEDPSKPLTRFLRKSVLKNAEPYVDADDNTFMGVSVELDSHIRAFLGDLDHYPMHFLMHFAHATQLVGYYHPDEQTRVFWYGMYEHIVHAFHLNVETEEHNEYRLRDCQRR